LSVHHDLVQTNGGARPVAGDDPGAAALLEAVRAQPVPEHVAIIMDGNGRWATQRGLPRVAGHREGVKAARAVVRAAAAAGLRYLTLYAFSTENWSRPQAEVSMLMSLLERSIHS
jgi:undecaprenyl diphosphate synthase